MKNLFLLLMVIFTIGCNERSQSPASPKLIQNTVIETETIDLNKSQNRDQNLKDDQFSTTVTDSKSIHIIVALCDNKYQGIAPVPAAIGNGQDPRNNLYWGAGYGIKTYFKKSSQWNFIEERVSSDSVLLERIVFKHRTKDVFLIADAYNGKYIKQTTDLFLKSSAGIKKDTLHIKGKIIGSYGKSEMLAYIGHNGLMEFDLNRNYINTDGKERHVAILACFSKRYFEPLLSSSNSDPVLWTTGLMAPEAYTIHDAITAYLDGKSNLEISNSAAMAYHKYQKCGINAAKRLLVNN